MPTDTEGPVRGVSVSEYGIRLTPGDADPVLLVFGPLAGACVRSRSPSARRGLVHRQGPQ